MTGKIWRSPTVGMSEAIDLGKPDPDPCKAAKRKQSYYAKFGRFIQ
ncbi:MAG: hypothetical protein LBL45_09945 [Treponema sp.]|nr:hypothetical protein [Treponema sp.]